MATGYKFPRLHRFRIDLLKTMLLTAFAFSTLVATLALFSLFPLTPFYRTVLYGYGLLNLGAYLLLSHDDAYYRAAMHVSILGSVVTFYAMTSSVVEDEFRLVWFFLTAFAAYIFGGTRYGLAVTAVIVVLLLYAYRTYDLHLSGYALFTFFCALAVFNIFAFAFIEKIKRDEALLKERIRVAVEAQRSQEGFLLRQHRLATFGEMLDAIAHQWRQPLMQSSAVICHTQLDLEAGRVERDALLASLAELSAVNRHMSETIEDFRSLFSDDRERVRVRVADAVDEVRGLLRHTLADVRVETQCRDVAIETVRSELLQVLTVLLSNAAEAGQARGLQDVRIVVSACGRDGAVWISVSDNAGGVEPGCEEKIFDPYFTTRHRHDGSGLGLYIARLVVEKSLKGTLTYEPATQGSVFHIRIEDG